MSQMIPPANDGSLNREILGPMLPRPITYAAFETVACAIYVRVSTDEQAKAEHYSLEAQEEYCMGEIRKRQSEGWVHRITISDPGYTGSTYDRPGLLRLIAMVKSGAIRVIVVYKRERLFRNADLAAQVQAIFDAHGVRVISYSEGMIDSSPHGVMMRQFVDASAQYERASGRKRVNDCLRFAAKQGDWKGGTPSFGYIYNRGSKILEPEEREAPIVKYMFEQIADGVTIAELLPELRRLGLYGRPSRKTRTGT